MVRFGFVKADIQPDFKDSVKITVVSFRVGVVAAFGPSCVDLRSNLTPETENAPGHISGPGRRLFRCGS
jgi:hypothetical protein